MIRSVRWQRVSAAELPDAVDRLANWACAVGGAVRHMLPLASVEAYGPEVLRVAERRGRWAACAVLPGRVLVPCGDAAAIRAAGSPVRRWRLVVGDAAPADALLGPRPLDPTVRVHVQRFLTVDPDRVPDEAELPDPGLRRAAQEDVGALAELAVQLHVDDGFGPDPGPAGLRGYAERLEEGVARGTVYCVGPAGRPYLKIERSVSSPRYGVQLAGICVERSRRNRGFGRAAVAVAVRAALGEGPVGRAVSLHVRERNEPALRAYVAVGFVEREEWRLAVRP